MNVLAHNDVLVWASILERREIRLREDKERLAAGRSYRKLYYEWRTVCPRYLSEPRHSQPDHMPRYGSNPKCWKHCPQGDFIVKEPFQKGMCSKNPNLAVAKTNQFLESFG